MFAQIEADLGHFDLDLFADREGRVALAKQWCCPESSAFMAEIHGIKCWAHPPRALITNFLAFVADAREKGAVNVALLIPCDAGAPWFRPEALSQWKRRQVWPAGSDLFRLAEDDGNVAGDWRWRKLPKTTVPYVVLTTW